MSLTFSYAGDPSASDVDAVRFEISDTDQSAPLLGDPEVAWVIYTETGVTADTGAVSLTDVQIFCAAARCMETLARRFAAQADQEVGDIKLTYSKQAQNYATRAQELRVKAQGLHSPTQVWSHSQKQALRSDPDRVQPAFARDQFRNPYTGRDEVDLPISDSPLDG